jgi:hypothetical protein
MNQYDPPRRTMRPVGTTIDGGDRNGHMGTNSCQAIRTVTSWRRGQAARGGRGAHGTRRGRSRLSISPGRTGVNGLLFLATLARQQRRVPVVVVTAAAETDLLAP